MPSQCDGRPVTRIAWAGYISIEKLRYFLSTSFPQMPFEPIAQTLKVCRIPALYAHTLIDS